MTVLKMPSAVHGTLPGLMLLALLALPTLAAAQAPLFLLQASNVTLAPGGVTTVPLIAANDLPIGAFSLGVLHDEILTVVGISPGAVVEAVDGGNGSSFWSAQITTNGAAAGFSGVVIFMIAADAMGIIDPIPTGTSQEIVRLEVSSPGGTPGSSLLMEIVDGLAPEPTPVNPDPQAVAVTVVDETGGEHNLQTGVVTIPGSVTLITPALEDLECLLSDPCSCEVTLSWINPYPYDAIEVFQGSTLLTTLIDSGNGLDTSLVTTIGDPAAGGGLETFTLIAYSGAVSSTSVACIVNCPGLQTPDAVEDLTCAPDPIGGSVLLTWNLGDNADSYTAIEIYVDGGLVEVVDSDETSISLDLGPETGVHLIEVQAIGDCGLSAPAVDCTIDLPHLFRRGDTNNSGSINLGDPINLALWLFQFIPYLPCHDAADADDNGDLQITDVLYLIYYLFTVGPPPNSPFDTCGADPTPDPLDCQVYTPCP